MHRARRALALANPLANVGPVVFVKHVPSTMSHQLTQYYGYEARPGGGVFVLDEPGRSMRVRRLGTSMPEGNYLHPAVSFDGSQIWFAFLRVRRPAPSATRARVLRTPLPSLPNECRRFGREASDRRALRRFLARRAAQRQAAVHLHPARRDSTVAAEGRATSTHWLPPTPTGPTPIQSPFMRPTSGILRCCTTAGCCTRGGDYVDRNAVFYQQLWSVRQDGSDVRIYFGNNTYNPTGTWESPAGPRLEQGDGHSRPASRDDGRLGWSCSTWPRAWTARGPVTRLTPDALFPESESGLAHGITTDKPICLDDPLVKTWGPQPQSQATRRKDVPEEEGPLARPLLPFALSAVGEILPGRLQLRSAAGRAGRQSAQHVWALSLRCIRE